MTNKPRFVVDTNTLVSAVLVEGSTPDRALRQVSAIVLMIRSLRRIARNSDRSVDLLEELLDKRREE